MRGPRRSVLQPGIIEVSTTWIKFAGIVASAAIAISVTAAKLVRKSDKLDAATEVVTRVDKLETHVGAIDTALAQIRIEVQEGSRSNRAISCFMARYPVGLCDDVAHTSVRQAGGSR